jgi:5-methylcytosine-specific restriction endonuclease McrA
MATRRFTSGRTPRLYDLRSWRRASRSFLQQNPRCVDCKAAGKLMAASDVDHIRPHQGDRRLFWDRENWAARCKGCHSSKTRLDEAEVATGRRPIKRGCDSSGFPLDGRHPWNLGR